MYRATQKARNDTVWMTYCKNVYNVETSKTVSGNDIIAQSLTLLPSMRLQMNTS